MGVKHSIKFSLSGKIKIVKWTKTCDSDMFLDFTQPEKREKQAVQRLIQCEEENNICNKVLLLLGFA